MRLVQKREKGERTKCADFCEVKPKEGAIEQFFDLGLTAGFKWPVYSSLPSSAKLDIVKGAKTLI